jgi:hypothetical protein
MRVHRIERPKYRAHSQQDSYSAKPKLVFHVKTPKISTAKPHFMMNRVAALFALRAVGRTLWNRIVSR